MMMNFSAGHKDKDTVEVECCHSRGSNCNKSMLCHPTIDVVFGHD